VFYNGDVVLGGGVIKNVGTWDDGTWDDGT